MQRDRGTKKWTAMMLPEHVEGLKQLFKEEAYKRMPILDEQQKIQNDFMLQAALKDDLQIQITYFKDHDFHTIEGHVLFMDILNGILRMDEVDVKLEHIIEVDFT